MKKILFSVFLIVFLSFAGINSKEANAVLGFAGLPTIVNLTLTSANTEYSVTLPRNVGTITIQSRTSADFKIGVTSGQSGTTYFTIKSGNAYYETTIAMDGTTLYFQSPNAGQVIEIFYFN